MLHLTTSDLVGMFWLCMFVLLSGRLHAQILVMRHLSLEPISMLHMVPRSHAAFAPIPHYLLKEAVSMTASILSDNRHLPAFLRVALYNNSRLSATGPIATHAATAG